MKIKTGEGYISIITLIAIWSVSLVTTLPGLAVSPILGKMDKIFPNVSHLEIQMLSCIPSLMIIPFVLLAGKLSEKMNKVLLLAVGLIIFLVSGLLCFLSQTMSELILFSGLLGIGAGLVIPLSTGLITDFFVGRYRAQQLGISSALTTFTMIWATLFTGYLAQINWHLSFIVYFLPALPLILTIFLREKNILKNISKPKSQQSDKTPIINPVKKNKDIPKSINVKQIISIGCFYFFISFSILVVLYNMPFVMQSYKMSSTLSGVVISVLFVTLMISGLLLYKIMTWLKNYTIPVALACQASGVLIMSLTDNIYIIFACSAIAGLGYGVMQPMMYDKASMTATGNRVFMALAWAMAGNYLAILVSPFLNEAIKMFFDSKSMYFTFRFNSFLIFIVFFLALIKRNSFLFGAKISNDVEQKD